VVNGGGLSGWQLVSLNGLDEVKANHEMMMKMMKP